MELLTGLLLLLVVLLIPTAYAGVVGAPYAPTFSPAIEKAFDWIGLDSEDSLIDLGAGDGKVLMAASRRGARALGYELSPIMWAVVWLRALGAGREIKIKLRDFFRQRLPDATVVFAFLMPKNMEKLRRYLAKQTMPGAKYLLVYTFPLPEDNKPLHVVRVPRCAPLYVYNLRELTK